MTITSLFLQQLLRLELWYSSLSFLSIKPPQNEANIYMFSGMKLSNDPSKKERGQRQRMQKGADCDIV